MGCIQNSKYYFRVGIRDAFAFLKSSGFAYSTKFADSSRSRKPSTLNLDFDFVPFLEGMHHILQLDITAVFSLVQGSGSKLFLKRPLITSLLTIIW
jgi:hypothetical protein